MDSLKYGPVLITKGDRKGHIGYYDDEDDDGKFLVYLNSPVFCNSYYKVKRTSATSVIPTECLVNRWEQLNHMLYGYSCGRSSKYTDLDIVEILQEKSLCTELLYDRYLQSVQGRQNAKLTDVFISHSSSDAIISRGIAIDLMDAGYSVFLDDWSISVGDRIFDKINDGLNSSTALIMIISKDYLSSVCCTDEWAAFYNKALRNNNCRIYPIIIDDSRPPAILSQIKYIRMTKEEYSDVLLQLLQALRRQFTH